MNEIQKAGYYSGLVAFTSTVGFVIVQILQLIHLLPYPCDEILIYGFSLCIPIPFLLEILALHYLTHPAKKYWSHAAVLFTTLYAVFVIVNYIAQLGTVIPMTLQGRASEIQNLIQTPHSLFWNFDAIGYIFMGLATLFSIPVFAKVGFQRHVRLWFLMHSSVTILISIVYFYPNFSESLLLLGLPWGITAPASMLMLALVFKKKGVIS